MMYDGVINKPPLDELYHFNKNHDPNNGQFTSGSGGGYSNAINLRTNKQLRKFQNEDGSLTKNGKRVFKKLIDLDTQHKKLEAEHKKANDQAQKYFNKHGKKLYKNDKDNKLALYQIDNKFKKISDDGMNLFRKIQDTKESINKERSRLSRINVEKDVIDEILKNSRR